MKTDPIPTLRLGPFGAGMSNRRPDYRLDQFDSGVKISYLRSAVNADLTEQGTLRRRRGYTREVAGGACHSLWSDGTSTFFVDGTTLRRVVGASGALEAQTVNTVMAAGRPVSFTQTPLGIFYSDGVALRRYDAAGDRLAGTPLFVAEPDVTAATGGSLPAGSYEVAFSYRRADGQESPATLPVRVDVAANGAVAITNLPATWPDTVTSLVIYMTPLNSATLLKAEALSSPATTHTITVVPAGGERCVTAMLAPMPAGHIVRFRDGRLMVARDNMLYVSEPYAPTLVNPSKGYLPFPKAIDIVEPVDGGTYIVADKTYWLTDEGLDELSPSTGVRGTGGQNPDDRTCHWVSDSGLVVGGHDGQVSNIQEKNNAVAPAQRGATLVREYDGAKRLLASLFGSGTTALVARSFMDAEVIRKGTNV